MLAGEHQVEQRRVAGGEADVGRGGCAQARLELLARAVGGGAQLRAQAVESRLGHRVEQGLAIGEVAARRAVADTDLARQLAQRQRVGAALAQRALGLLEQRLAQRAVVIGAIGHGGVRLSE